MKIIRGFKTELNPNNAQRTMFLKAAGVARFAYNWGLQQKLEAKSAGLKMPDYMTLSRRLNAIKDVEFPWMREVSKCAPHTALKNLDKAFEAFFRKWKAKKAGLHKGKLGFPKFKSKKHGVGSFSLSGTVAVEYDRIQLPRIGVVRLKERYYLPIVRQVPLKNGRLSDDCRLLNTTISERAGRWYVSVLVEIEVPDNPEFPESVVGVDLGVNTFVTCSDGATFDSPRALKSNLARLKRLCRRVSRKKKGSANRCKAAKRLATFHKKISDIRKDAIHKITSHLAKTKTVAVIEDLNVSGMMQNRHLSRTIADMGFYMFRHQLQYKGEWYGCQVLAANRFFPSSKMCSRCGEIKDDLKLKERIYECGCGNKIDRDLNAAINLKQSITVGSTGNYVCGEFSSGRARRGKVKLGSSKQKVNKKQANPVL